MKVYHDGKTLRFEKDGQVFTREPLDKDEVTKLKGADGITFEKVKELPEPARKDFKHGVKKTKDGELHSIDPCTVFLRKPSEEPKAAEAK